MNKSSEYLWCVCGGRGGIYGRTTHPEYPRILSIPDTVFVWPWGMYGGTTWEDPKYPGILSIPDTVCVRGGMYGGTTWEEPLYNQCRSTQRSVVYLNFG